jgi:hypothetical protein
MKRVDTRPKECADPGPTRSRGKTSHRQTDSRIQPPWGSPDSARAAKLQHADTTAWPDHSRQLAHRGRRSRDVPQQVTERERIECAARERKCIRGRANRHCIAQPRLREHLLAHIKRNDTMPSLLEQARDEAGPRGYVEDARPRWAIEPRHHLGAPARILAQTQDRRPPLVVARDWREQLHRRAVDRLERRHAHLAPSPDTRVPPSQGTCTSHGLPQKGTLVAIGSAAHSRLATATTLVTHYRRSLRLGGRRQ